MNNSIQLPNDWILKGFKAIFKELTPNETLKKINLDGAVIINGKKMQSITCIAYPTNRYFRIDPDKVFVRKRFSVTKDQQTLLKYK